MVKFKVSLITNHQIHYITHLENTTKLFTIEIMSEN